jgi:hypothetical protein
MAVEAARCFFSSSSRASAEEVVNELRRRSTAKVGFPKKRVMAKGRVGMFMLLTVLC